MYKYDTTLQRSAEGFSRIRTLRLNSLPIEMNKD